MIAQEYGDAGIFVLKDPRVCRFADFYVDVLREFNVEVRYVVAQRNPADVIASLASRDAMTLNFASLVWLRHVLDAEKFSRAGKRVFVSYETSLADWRTTLARIVHGLNLDEKTKLSDARELDTFLKPEMRHHRTTVVSAGEESLTSQWLKRAHDSLLKLERNAEASEAIEALDQIAAEFEGPAAAFGAAIFPELKKRDQTNAVERREKGVYFAGVFETLKGEVRDHQARAVDQAREHEESLSRRLKEQEALHHSALQLRLVEQEAHFSDLVATMRREIETGEASTKAAENCNLALNNKVEELQTQLSAVRQRAIEDSLELQTQLSAVQKRAHQDSLDAHTQVLVARAQLEELNALTGRQQDELKVLRDHFEALQAARWNAELRLVDVQRTLSWRVTAPLRAVRRRLPKQ